MDAVQTAASIESVGRILEAATQAVLKQTEKMMKVAVTMAVELGKGENIDVTG